ncbi:MAG: hypothetical protein V9G13_10235 [Marmoricola sp.]
MLPRNGPAKLMRAGQPSIGTTVKISESGEVLAQVECLSRGLLESARGDRKPPWAMVGSTPATVA